MRFNRQLSHGEYTEFLCQFRRLCLENYLMYPRDFSPFTVDHILVPSNMGSEVNKSECHVQIGVKNCFQCALLLTVVGFMCVVLLSCEYCCYLMCIVVLCVLLS